MSHTEDAIPSTLDAKEELSNEFSTHHPQFRFSPAKNERFLLQKTNELVLKCPR